MRGQVIHISTIGPRDQSPRVSEPAVLGRCGPSGKRTYATEDDALQAAVHFQQQNAWVVDSKAAYRCRDGCGGWHLTGQGPR